jgi:DNA-binding NarL/FixJ family response regulator
MARPLNHSYAMLHGTDGASIHGIGRTSILLIEEHGAISELVSAFLESRLSHMQILGAVQTLEEARAVCEEILPDVIIFEPLMPGIVPLEMVNQLLALCPRAKMLAFTRSQAPGLVAEMRMAGIRGVVTRRQPLSEFVEALKAVAKGELFFEGENSVPEDVSVSPRLTGREKLVVRLVSEGLSTKEIAEKMEVSSKTVDKFRQKAMNKLDLHDAVRVTRYAITNGLSPFNF